MCNDTSIFVLLSGVEMWKVTPSKSETTWSMLAVAPLCAVSYLAAAAAERKAAGYCAPIDSLLVVQLLVGGLAWSGGQLSRAVMRRTEVCCDAGRWA